MNDNAKQIIKLLEDRGIDFEVYEHNPITSVEESKQLGLPHEGAGTKNFFLRAALFLELK